MNFLCFLTSDCPNRVSISVLHRVYRKSAHVNFMNRHLNDIRDPLKKYLDQRDYNKKNINITNEH